jgi:choline dehydrogenase-like flavoprotein
MSTTRFELNDDSVAVVIGSGAGGGVLASELCRMGKRVVCLEAGPSLTMADYRNDEFFSFQQLTWMDKRSASGSWSVARSSPGFPAYTSKAVGGTTDPAPRADGPRDLWRGCGGRPRRLAGQQR